MINPECGLLADNEASNPRSEYHHKLTNRYPQGTLVRQRRDAQATLYEQLAGRRNPWEGVSTHPMQPATHLLEAVDYPFDIVAPTVLLHENQGSQAIMIIEDHFRVPQNYPFSMGKSTIVQELVGIPAPCVQIQAALGMDSGEKLPPGELLDRMQQTGEIPFSMNPRPGIQLVTGDITFIGRDANGRLVAMPPVASREDTIWDIARRGVRTTASIYDRTDTNIKKAQLSLANRIVLSDDSVWANINEAYPVTEVIVLTPDSEIHGPAAWGNHIDSPSPAAVELEQQLQRNPLYLSEATSFWSINPQNHRETVEGLFKNGIKTAPTITYLHIKDPRQKDNLMAAQTLMESRYGRVIQSSTNAQQNLVYSAN